MERDGEGLSGRDMEGESLLPPPHWYTLCMCMSMPGLGEAAVGLNMGNCSLQTLLLLKSKHA